MADKKFSQFDIRTDPSQIDALVGFEGSDNVKIDPSDLIKPSKFMVTGTFQNLFGGSPGLFGDTLEFGGAKAVPAGSHSSVLTIPFDCTIIGAGIKWIYNSPIATLDAGDEWQVKLYKMTNLQGSTTNSGSYGSPVDFTGLLFDSSDSNTFPYKFSSTLSIDLDAGDIINVSGVETGTIGTADAEVEMTIALVPR